jgi:general secretion pathway protein N
MSRLSLRPHGRHSTYFFKATLPALLLGCLCAVICFAPAQWLADALSQATHGRIQLRQARGSIWHGSAQWLLASGTDAKDALALPQRIRWRLTPQSLVSWQFMLEADCCSTKPVLLNLQATWQSLSLSLHSPDSTWPVSWLSGLGEPWNTIGLQGLMHIQHSQLHWQWHDDQWQINGQAQLTLSDISCDLSTLKPLGSYVLELQGGEVPALRLYTTQGGLQLEGSGTWQPGQFRFHGQARAQAGFEDVLSNLLGVLGQRDGDKTILHIG